jgi:predicted kinase
MSEKKLVVLRGIPGSGKSTIVRGEFPAAVVVSADDYFVGEDGVYRFNSADIGNAHGRCFRLFIEALQRGDSQVVVDNTATSIAEVAPYMLAAQAYGYNAEIITLRCDPEIAASRNVHGVPAATVHRMAEALEAGSLALMPWWQHRVIGQS